MAEKGHELIDGNDLIKNPFVLEFLDIKESSNYLENDLEKNILNHLKEFLLELGRGFMFVGSQVRFTIEEDNFYPDLVFYIIGKSYFRRKNSKTILTYFCLRCIIVT